MVVKRHTGVGVGSELFDGAVDDLAMFVWGELRLAGFDMTEFNDELGDVAFHRKPSGAILVLGGIVPGDVDASELGAGEIVSDCMMFILMKRPYQHIFSQEKGERYLVPLLINQIGLGSQLRITSKGKVMNHLMFQVRV